jgi:hypothetical protein
MRVILYRSLKKRYTKDMVQTYPNHSLANDISPPKDDLQIKL